MKETELHAKLDVLCEIVRRVEEKVTTQNGNVARLTEWRIQHTEQTSEVNRKIDYVETKLKALDPVIATMKYPKVVLLAIAAIVLLSVKTSLVSVLSFIGL